MGTWAKMEYPCNLGSNIYSSGPLQYLKLFQQIVLDLFKFCTLLTNLNTLTSGKHCDHLADAVVEYGKQSLRLSHVFHLKVIQTALDSIM